MIGFVLLVGAIVGSFLNVCIVRWPAGESVVRPRSRCPRCARPVAWYDNVPVLSWVVLRGRCRGCAEPISVQYPLVELATAGLWGAAWWAAGPTWLALRFALTATLLLGIAVADLRYYLIPDGFTVSGFVFAIGAACLAAVLGDAGPFAGPWEAVLGACAGAGAIAIIGWLGEVAFGREAMGQGDVTLMAFAGALVGPGRSFAVILIAAAIASAVFVGLVAPIGWVRARRRGEPFALPLVPFGVFLAPATLVALLWGDALIGWYLGLLGPVA